MSTPRTFLALLLLTSLAAARTEPRPAPAIGAPTSAPAPVLPESIRTGLAAPHLDETRTYYDEPRAGVLWARGARYKTGFDARGATYYPLFGRRHAHAPMSLSPDLVTAGGVAVDLDRGSSWTRAGDRVEFDRGAFREVYDLGPDSIEQTFVFERPTKAGDIVVRIPVDTTLAACTASAGLEFHGAGGHVTYSRAVAIDAAGRRQDAATELVDGAISIRVDAAFADSARFPLVIDPVITTFAIAGPGFAPGPDVAVDAAAGCWLVTYGVDAAFNDRDVYAVTLNLDGSLRASGYVDSSPNSWTKARCAHGSPDQFLVVAEVDEFLEVASIRARRIIGSTFTVGPEVMVSQFSEGHCLAPVVGSDASDGGPTNNTSCVVYTRGLPSAAGELVQRRVSSTTVTSAQVVTTTLAGVEATPSISGSNTGFEWLVVWKTAGNGAGLTKIQARRIHLTGGFLGAVFDITNGNTREELPSVSSAVIHPAATATFLVATQLRTGSDNDVQLAAVRSGAVIQSLNLSAALGIAATNQSMPAVDADASHFVVVYQQAGGGPTELRATELAYTDDHLSILQAHQSFGTLSQGATFPRICAFGHREPVGGPPELRHGIVWEVGSSNVRGGIYQALRGGPKTPYCFGDGSGTACPCGNSSAPGAESGCTNSFATAGRLIATGDASLRGDTLVLEASGLPTNGAPPTFFQGTLAANGGAGSVFGDGLRCAVGTVLRLGSPASSAGTARLGYGVPGTPLVSVQGAIPGSGGTRHYQAMYRNNAGFCTPATFNATNGVTVVWAL